MPLACRPRFIVASTTLIAALFVLSGCVKSELTMTIGADDTVTGAVVLGIDKGFLESPDRTQQEAIDETFAGLEADPTADIPGSNGPQPYEDDKYAGRQTEFENVPFAEFSERQNRERPFTLVHENGEYVFTMTVDVTAHPNLNDDVRQSMELLVAVTFPGEVTDTNGQVEPDGVTVRWSLDATESTTLTATAEEAPAPSAEPSDSASPQAAGDPESTPWYATTGAAVMVVALSALVIGGALLWIQLRRWRKAPAPTTFAVPMVPDPAASAGHAPQPQWPGSLDQTQEIPVIPGDEH